MKATQNFSATSANNFLNVINLFLSFFRFNPNLSKYESAGIGSLKRIRKTLKGSKDLTNLLFYEKEIERKKDFQKVLLENERDLRIW